MCCRIALLRQLRSERRYAITTEWLYEFERQRIVNYDGRSGLVPTWGKRAAHFVDAC